jgi:hypothetical protein
LTCSYQGQGAASSADDAQCQAKELKDTAGELQHWLEAAGFQQVEVTVVAREDEPPHFETILAGGVK